MMTYVALFCLWLFPPADVVKVRLQLERNRVASAGAGTGGKPPGMVSHADGAGSIDDGRLRGQPSVAVCAIKAAADSFHYLAVSCASRGVVSCCQLFRASYASVVEWHHLHTITAALQALARHLQSPTNLPSSRVYLGAHRPQHRQG